MDISRDELLGGALGGLVGAIVAGVLFQAGASDTLEAQASLYGRSGTTAAWGVHLAHGVALGVGYAGAMSVATDWYLTRIVSLTQDSPAIATVLVPLTGRFGVSAVVAVATGLQFGLAVWLVGVVLVLPLATGDAALSAPALAAALLGGLGYGLVLGAVYGRLIEQ